jgi:3-dehydroquinate dehydratase-2
VELHFLQTNHEGAILDAIHAEAEKGTHAILINPGAYTHTSIAIRDALAAFHGLKIEVHLSNIFQREEFRHKSLISPVVHATLSGFGPLGYRMGLTYALQTLEATLSA